MYGFELIVHVLLVETVQPSQENFKILGQILVISQFSGFFFDIISDHNHSFSKPGIVQSMFKFLKSLSDF